MPEMPNNLVTILSSAGMWSIFFWWTTTRLIPELQKERAEAIVSFHNEMEAERRLHREANDKLMALLEKVLDKMMDERLRT